MARYYWSKKSTTDDYSKAISVFVLLRDKFLQKWVSYNSWTLRWTRNGEPNGNISIHINKDDYRGSMRVVFTQTDRSSWEKKDLDYTIQLESSPCHLWGRRWWFLCPCRWNRCAKLYLQNNGIFASRKTLDLSYESRNTSKKWRFLDHIFWKWTFPEQEKLRASIKYPYRSGRPTRKMKRYLKMTSSPYTEKELHEMEMRMLKM